MRERTVRRRMPVQIARAGLRTMIVGFALLAAACKDDGVRNGLRETYGPALIGQDSTGRYSVLFLDSPFAEQPEARRARTARKVAEYVRDHLLDYKTVSEVEVAFQSKKEGARNEFEHVAATYTFTRAELGDPGP